MIFYLEKRRVIQGKPILPDVVEKKKENRFIIFSAGAK